MTFFEYPMSDILLLWDYGSADFNDNAAIAIPMTGTAGNRL